MQAEASEACSYLEGLSDREQTRSERFHYRAGEQGVNNTTLLIQPLRAFTDIHYSLLSLREQEDAVFDRGNAPK